MELLNVWVIFTFLVGIVAEFIVIKRIVRRMYRFITRK